MGTFHFPVGFILPKLLATNETQQVEVEDFFKEKGYTFHPSYKKVY
jgi:hypothetical protein